MGTIIAWIIIGGAILILVWKLYKIATGKDEGGCGGCPKDSCCSKKDVCDKLGKDKEDDA